MTPIGNEMSALLNVICSPLSEATSKTSSRELTPTMFAPPASASDYSPLRFWLSRRR